MKLGKYKGLSVQEPDLTVTEAEIDKVLRNKQQHYALRHTIDDRPAQMGDDVIISYNIECEGKPVPNKARSGGRQRLGAASNPFTKRLESVIVGHKPGDDIHVAVNIPANSQSALAGKTAIVHIDLKELFLSEYQPIDDNFARDFSEFDTLQEWRAQICEDIAARKEESAYSKMLQELLTQVIEGSEIPIDVDLKDELTMELMEDFVYELEENGMTFATYCKRTGQTKQQIRMAKEQEAIRSIQEQSVLHAIANKENLEVTDMELAEEICAMAAEEGIEINQPEDFEQLIDEEEFENIIDQLLINKAMQFICDHAIIE